MYPWRKERGVRGGSGGGNKCHTQSRSLGSPCVVPTHVGACTCPAPPPVRVRQCGLSHSNGESEREEPCRANVAAVSLCEDLSILPHREAFVAGRDGRDNTGLGGGRGSGGGGGEVWVAVGG